MSWNRSILVFMVLLLTLGKVFFQGLAQRARWLLRTRLSAIQIRPLGGLFTGMLGVNAGP